MATLLNLPTELLFTVMSHVSYRDRAHVACASRRGRDIADNEWCYKTQYIRDFGDPESHFYFTHSKISEEISWKSAYERRHYADMPLLVYDRLTRSCWE